MPLRPDGTFEFKHYEPTEKIPTPNDPSKKKGKGLTKEIAGESARQRAIEKLTKSREKLSEEVKQLRQTRAILEKEIERLREEKANLEYQMRQ